MNDLSAPLGVIAGDGSLPEKVIEACRRKGRDVFVVSLRDDTDLSSFPEDVPHVRLNIGAVKKAVNAFRDARVQEIVMAGAVKRPNLAKVRPDSGGIKLLARIAKLKRRGDDALLHTCAAFFEEHGFTVRKVHEVVTGLLAEAGAAGSAVPGETALRDIAIGAKAARALGALDIGQAVVVENGLVLGVEAVEGTDKLIERAGGLRRDGGGPVLVKMKKPGQDERTDLPSVGVQTVLNAHKYGFAGIAYEAGGSFLLDREETVAKADSLGLFLYGVPAEEERGAGAASAAGVKEAVTA